jgi:hypothetical protein
MKAKSERAAVARADLYGTHFGPAVASVILSRLGIFWPSTRAAGEHEWAAEGPWGKVTIKGRLSQTHRGIMDGIFAHAIASKRTAEGTFVVVVNPYQVMRAAGIKHPKRSWFKVILLDMRRAEVTIEETGKQWPHVAGIISEFIEHDVCCDLHGAMEGRDGRFMKITFSSAWMRIFDATLAVRYASLLPAISALRSGASQALVRHVITHRTCYGSLEKILTTILALREGMSRRQMYEVLATVRGDAVAMRRDFGIEINGDSLSYSQHAQVKFSSPETLDGDHPGNINV